MRLWTVQCQDALFDVDGAVSGGRRMSPFAEGDQGGGCGVQIMRQCAHASVCQ